MDFNFTIQQTRFREELRDFLRAEVPLEKQEVFGLLTEEQYQFGREINLKLAERDWLAVGWPEEQGRALLEEFLEWTTQPKYIYKHAWQPRDLVMWDNRCFLHRGRPWDAATDRRVMRRTTLLGDGPTV